MWLLYLKDVFFVEVLEAAPNDTSMINLSMSPFVMAVLYERLSN